MSDGELSERRRRSFDDINIVFKQIPPGKVMTYGQVGRQARANARVVGWAMANVDDPEVPWQRVVGAEGYLRIGRRSAEMMSLQRNLLEHEGVSFLQNGCVKMDEHNFAIVEDGSEDRTES